MLVSSVQYISVYFLHIRLMVVVAFVRACSRCVPSVGIMKASSSYVAMATAVSPSGTSKCLSSHRATWCLMVMSAFHLQSIDQSINQSVSVVFVMRASHNNVQFTLATRTCRVLSVSVITEFVKSQRCFQYLTALRDWTKQFRSFLSPRVLTYRRFCSHHRQRHKRQFYLVRV